MKGIVIRCFVNVLLIVVVTLACSCSGEERRVYYDTGELRTICEMSNGEKNGKCTYYYKDGKVKGKSYFVDGLQEGETVKYDTMGNLVEVQNFISGKSNGAVTMYHPNGQIKFEGFYKDNKPDSLGYEYYANGKLYRIYYYRDGVISYYKAFDRQGILYDCLLPLNISSDEKNDSLFVNIELMYSLYKNDITLGVIFCHLSEDNIPIDTIDIVAVDDMRLNEYPIKNSNILKSDKEIAGVVFEIENSTDLIKGDYYFKHKL